MSNYVIALILSLVMLLFHLLGIEEYYFSLKYYDFLPHFVGGIAIGFLLYGLLNGLTKRPNNKNTYIVLSLMVVIGLLWEVFEVSYDITGHPIWTSEYYIDTVKDIIVDVFGASIALVLISISSLKDRF